MADQRNQEIIQTAGAAITEETIPCCVNYFNKSEELKETVLKRAFSNKKNEYLEEVLVKVTLLNAFYSTQLFNNPGNYNGKRKNADIQVMAKHIVDLAINKGLDDKMATGDLEAVELIRQIDPNRYSSATSFATKFCSWHNSDSFPIMDRYSKGMLYYLNRADNGLFKDFNNHQVTKTGLNDYKTFCNIHHELREYISKRISTFSCKDIDKFLWCYGVHNKISIE